MNTRQKLSWTLLGVALFFGIAAVSTDTTFFKNLSLSGSIKLSGQPEELTVAGGALLFDGNPVGGGGESLWATNSDGWITPAGGEYLTNTLVFKSGLADNATNVAAVIDTKETWTDGSLLAVRNNGTNQFDVAHDGEIAVGRAAFSGGITLGSVRDVEAGDNDWNSLYLSMKDTGAANATSTFTVDVYTYEIYLNALLNDNGVQTSAALVIDSGVVDFAFYVGGEYRTFFRPAASESATPYKLGTSTSHTSGYLTEISNNETNKFAVAFDGATTIAQSLDEPAAPAAGYFTLFATNNAGKMVLKVKFPTGDSQVIATEP